MAGIPRNPKPKETYRNQGVRLPDRLYLELRKIAEVEGYTYNKVCEMLLESGVADHFKERGWQRLSAAADDNRGHGRQNFDDGATEPLRATRPSPDERRATETREELGSALAELDLPDI